MYKLGKQERLFREANRGKYPESARWYALMVYGGKERQVRDWLDGEQALQGLDEILLPEVVEPVKRGAPGKPVRLLFTSYAFIRCQMTDEVYATIVDHRYIFQILGHSFRIPTPLRDEEINRLKAILGSGGEPEVTASVGTGDQVLVVNGAMAGVRGRIVEVRSKDVRVETDFSFLDAGASVSVVVPKSQIEIQGADECDHVSE